MFAGVSKDGTRMVLRAGLLGLALIAAAGTAHAADRDGRSGRDRDDDRTSRNLSRPVAAAPASFGDRGGRNDWGGGGGGGKAGGGGARGGDKWNGHGGGWGNGGNRGGGSKTNIGVSINIGGPICPPPRPICRPVVVVPCPPPVVVIPAPCPPAVVVRNDWGWRRPVLVSTPVVVERPVVIERPVIIEKTVIVERPMVQTSAAGRAQDRDLGDAYMQMGDFDNASRVYQRYLSAWDGDGEVTRSLGVAMIGDGEAQDGFRTFVRGYQLESGLFHRELTAEDLGGATAAQKVLDAAVRGATASNTADAWFTVTILQATAGNREIAVQTLQKARDAGLSTSLLDALTLMVNRQTA